MRKYCAVDVRDAACRIGGQSVNRHSGLLRLVCSAVAIATMAGAVDAQVAPIVQGRILDANPQVGSGGSNQPVPGYVPANTNVTLTRNGFAPQTFQVNNYTSPYGGQGGYRSPAVSQFLARLTAPAVGPTYNPQLLYQPYFLPSQSSAGGLTTYGSVANTPAFGNAAGIYANSNPLQQSNLDLPYQDYNSIPVPTYEPMVSNNLYGLRQRPITPDQVGDPSAAQYPTTQPGTELNLLTPRDYGDQAGTKIVRTDNGVGARVKPGETEKPIDGQVAAATPLGKPETGFVGQTNSDVYENLMAEVNASKAKRIAVASTATQLVENPTWVLPGVTDATGHFTGQYAQLGQGGMPIEGGIGSAQDNMGGSGERAPTKTQSTNPLEKDYRPKQYNSADDPLNSRAILQASRKVKKVETLAGVTKTTFNGIMRQAEGLMKSGDYLHAAEFYQGAISLEPDNALAVVGRAHAELAAGLYESGAYDLKFLYHRHPELMALHYDMPEFMGQKRLDFINDDVRTLARKGVAAASFLACYFDYQQGRQDTLLADFADWYARHPNDTWGPVVEKAWVSEDAPDKPNGDNKNPT